MNHFISEVERQIVTGAGHIIDFLAGVPTHVPPESQREVLAAGCVPAPVPALVEAVDAVAEIKPEGEAEVKSEDQETAV